MTRRMESRTIVGPDGRRLSRAEWAAELGISRQALDLRIREARARGEAPAAALYPRRTNADRAERIVGIGGRALTVAEWAAELGLPVITLRSRMRLLEREGRPVAEALRPVQPRPRRVYAVGKMIGATDEQRARWRLAAQITGRDVGDVAREALDAWADSVINDD